MLIHCSYDIACAVSAPTVMVFMLHLRPELAPRIRSREKISLRPLVPTEIFLDSFGNRCLRLTAPSGQLELRGETLVEDTGWPAPVVADAREHAVAELPRDVLPYLLPSRYCEVDLLGKLAWTLFGHMPPGWSRVQAICDWVHEHLMFDPAVATASRTAWQAFAERTGVCRDFTHLAVTLCRCLNIPARYVTGYLTDVGMPPDSISTGFGTCMQVWLGDQWHTFDVRHNTRCVGYLPIAHGRDAGDVALVTSFGPHQLSLVVARAREAFAVTAVA